MIESSCHCGAVQLKIDAETPETLTSCNCSICRKYGNLMAYFSPSKVTIVASNGTTQKYIWGDKLLAFVRCASCGCLSHWESLDPAQTTRMGVNARLFEGIDLSKIRIRRFDGANTWKFLD